MNAKKVSISIDFGKDTFMVSIRGRMIGQFAGQHTASYVVSLRNSPRFIKIFGLQDTLYGGSLSSQRL